MHRITWMATGFVAGHYSSYLELINALLGTRVSRLAGNGLPPMSPDKGKLVARPGRKAKDHLIVVAGLPKG